MTPWVHRRAAILAVGLACLVSGGATTRPTTRGGLALEVEAVKREYSDGEAILLRARFTGHGISLQLSDHGGGAEYFYLVLEDFPRPGERYCRRLNELQLIELPGIAERGAVDWLHPITAEYQKQLLIWGRATDRILILRPGEYRLRIGYALESGAMKELVGALQPPHGAGSPNRPFPGAFRGAVLSEPVAVRVVPAEKTENREARDKGPGAPTLPR